MNAYEILYIIDNAVEETKRDALISQYEEMIKADGGKVEKTDKWGDKKYNYPIKFKESGFYVLMTFKSKPGLLKEIERKMGNNEQIVRKMIIKKD